MRITVRIRRFNPDFDKKQRWETYSLELEPTDRVLDALNEIKAHQDGTLTYRRSCGHGICGSDAMLINGRNRLACKEKIQDLGENISVEPMRGFAVIKDLVVDMKPFMAKYRSIMPYLINDEPPPEKERLQSAADRARFDDTTKCIMCGACTMSCPSVWANPQYVGPQAIVQAHRFIFDSRDQGAAQRLSILAEANGVWPCHTIYNCTVACPRDIEVTRAIQEVKLAITSGRV
jgi:succinate dehydrogenase / fumarate reductase, iron-sulfur subunit